MDYLTAKQIMFIHSRLIMETGGSQGVHDLSALESAVGRPQSSFDDQDLYPDLGWKQAGRHDCCGIVSAPKRVPVGNIPGRFGQDSNEGSSISDNG